MPTRPSATHRSSHQGGFSLIEVLLATLLLGYVLASSQALFMTASTRAVLTEDPVTARQLASEIHQMAKLLPREDAVAGVVTQAADVIALGSLHGAVFSPPIRADGTTNSALSGWSQSVQLEVVSLDAPGTALLDDPKTAVASNSASLYRLSVTVAHQGTPVDTYRWWVRL